MPKKITLYITDFTLHTRKFRSATKLENSVSEKQGDIEHGRIYTNDALIETTEGTRYMIKFPEELQRQIDAGEVEVELVLPEGGVPIRVGKDALEKIAQIKKKERLKLARSCRSWRKE